MRIKIFFIPIGLDSKPIILSLLTGLVAKENIISTLESEDMETIYTMFEENADLRNATINFLRGL